MRGDRMKKAIMAFVILSTIIALNDLPVQCTYVMF
jgi:hypothetical protein